MKMTPNFAIIIRGIANGQTMGSLAQQQQCSTSTIRSRLAKGCNAIGLPSEVEYIRANAALYLVRVPAPPSDVASDLRPGLQRELCMMLDLKDPSALTARLLCNLTASQLIDRGLTTVSVGQVQRWLLGYGASLKRGSIINRQELHALDNAIALLQAYHLDVAVAAAQLRDETESFGQ